MREERFGVVVVNWNGADDTMAALNSLLSANPRPDHVVLVDNGSADDSLSRLRGWCIANVPSWHEATSDSPASVDDPAWLFLIPAGDNLGFSGANNVGLRYLATRTAVSHFLLLNNDATIAPDYFAQIAIALATVPDAGLIGSLIFRHPERDRIWFAGGIEIPWRALIRHLPNPPSMREPYPTPFITGCAMMISRPLFENEGGLAEVYNPIYWEDAEYSRRALTRGWTVVVAPTAHVYHRVGGSGQGEALTPRTAYLQNRNRAFYVRRNYRGSERIVALAYLIATKPARAVVEIARGRLQLGSAIFRGFMRGVTQRIV